MISAVTILKLKSKIAIFCQNRPNSKSLYLVSHVSISSCFDFLQQLMDVTGLKDYTIFVVIVLTHVGVSCRPTASGWHNTKIVHFDKLYKLYNCQFSMVVLYCRSDNFGWLVTLSILSTEKSNRIEIAIFPSKSNRSRSSGWKSHIVTALKMITEVCNIWNINDMLQDTASD